MVEIPININRRPVADKFDDGSSDCLKEAELTQKQNAKGVAPNPSAADEKPAKEAPTGSPSEAEKKPAAAPENGENSSTGEHPARESEIERLQKEIDKLQKDNREMQEQVLRVRAEAENFRKRLQKEKDDFARFAREGFIRELLPVKDNLERALAHADEDPGSIVDGVRLTLEQFESILKNMGVEVVESQGQPFDPNLHEAMAQVESADCEPNTVVNEFQKGYTLHGRLLRPAMVAVAKAGSKEN